MRFLTAGFLILISSAASADSPLTTPDVWRDHLNNDLLPFWSDPYAAGTPVGAFAPRLCNDGSQPMDACTGVTQSQAINPVATLVGQSRQVFSYAIAFHMTGNTTYLDLAKAGTQYQFDTFLDDTTGLFYEQHNVNTGGTSGAFNSQKQAYGLLGPSFLYYLTADEALYNQIKDVEQAITSAYRLPATGGYSVAVGIAHPANAIAKHLDQLNSYKTLLAAQVPLADRSTLQQEALETAYFIKNAFFDPSTGGIKPRLDTPDGSAVVDFGHSIKSFWFMDQTAQLAGDAALSTFAQTAAKSLLKNAFEADAGAWITNITEDGTRNPRAHWWGFAELNQYAASLAIEDPELRDMLAQTQAYWLETFVDPTDKGIWSFVDIATDTPETLAKKHWEWKAGFHSYEHALINYLAASGISGETIDLYFERADAGTLDLAYGFSGDVNLLTSILNEGDTAGIQRLELSNLTYAAAAPVPLPAGALLLFSGLLLLRRATRVT